MPPWPALTWIGLAVGLSILLALAAVRIALHVRGVPLSSRRKVAMALWRGPREGYIHARLAVDVEEGLAYLAWLTEQTGSRASITHLVGKAVGEVCAETSLRPPTIPLISNVSGLADPGAFTATTYWVEHVRAAGDLAGEGGRFALSGRPLDLPGDERHHVVVPGALYVAAILAVAADRYACDEATLRDVQFLWPLAVYRPALVLGHSETGCCVSPDSWPVLLLRACMHMGSLPDRGLPPMHLVPVDRVSRAIAEGVLGLRTGVLPLTHPDTWDEAMLRRVLGRRGIDLREVSWEQWQRDLARASTDPSLAALGRLVTVLPTEPREDAEPGEHAGFAGDLPDPELLLDRTVAWLLHSGALDPGDAP